MWKRQVYYYLELMFGVMLLYKLPHVTDCSECVFCSNLTVVSFHLQKRYTVYRNYNFKRDFELMKLRFFFRMPVSLESADPNVMRPIDLFYWSIEWKGLG